MKNRILAIAVLAGSLALSSCSYLECATAANKEECIAGKAIDQAMGYLANSSNITTTEQADDFAGKWSTIQTCISTAQGFGVKIPQATKTAYNKTLSRCASKNYFGSSSLRSAMSGATPL